MRIVCPACSARYEVKEALLIPGRKTRCARCAAEWVPLRVDPPAPAKPEEPADPDAPPLGMTSLAGLSAMDRLGAHPYRPMPSMALRLAWVTTAMVVPLLVGCFFGYREAVMEAWPASARLYSAFGLVQTDNSSRR